MTVILAFDLKLRRGGCFTDDHNSANDSAPVPDKKRGARFGHKGHGRKILDLPEVELIHEIPDDQMYCPICGKPRRLTTLGRADGIRRQPARAHGQQSPGRMQDGDLDRLIASLAKYSEKKWVQAEAEKFLVHNAKEWGLELIFRHLWDQLHLDSILKDSFSRADQDKGKDKGTGPLSQQSRGWLFCRPRLILEKQLQNPCTNIGSGIIIGMKNSYIQK